MVFWIKNDNISELVKKYNANKLSHVFLIETNDATLALHDLLELVKILNCQENQYNEKCDKCNLCHLIATDSLPTLRVVFPDGQAIKKSQMEELKQHFLGIPYLSRYNVYIINEAEKFNASSANMMLKFIEEPESNLIGFLITNNRENVIHTIKSRCEIIKANYEVNQTNYSYELEQLAIDYLYHVEVEKTQSIVYNKIILDQKLDREMMIPFFKSIYQIYVNLLDDKEINEKLVSLNKLSKRDLFKRISLVMEMIERLNYNVNIQLLLDAFVLEMED